MLDLHVQWQVQYTLPFRCKSEMDKNPKFRNLTFGEMYDFVATAETKELGNQFGDHQCEVRVVPV